MKYKSARTSDPLYFVRWISHAEKRKLALQSAGLFGVIAISVYFLWLGFTPSADIGQTSLMLIGAVLIGMMLVGLAITMFASVWVYAAMGVKTESIPSDIRFKTWMTLVARSISAQLVGASILIFVACALSTVQDSYVHALKIGSAIAIFLFGVLLLFAIPRLPKETRSEYLGLAVLFALCGLISALMTIFFYVATPSEDRAHWLTVIGVLFFVISVSGVIGVVPISRWLGQTIFVIASLAYVLIMFNNSILPARIVAVNLGIAEAHPVSLILSKENCERLKVNLKNSSLECVGEQAGLLRNVILLNSLGDRWVIQIQPKGEKIIFQGKDTIVIRPR